jgi:hypothetical protein
LKTIPAGSPHKPYSRVLEGHHLSIRHASQTNRARKSPVIVDPIWAGIRNATRSVLPQGKLVNKEKEKRTKKENGSLWKMPQLWKSAKRSVAFGTIFLMRISTAAWKSLASGLGFPTFTTGSATTVNHDGTIFHP